MNKSLQYFKCGLNLVSKVDVARVVQQPLHHANVTKVTGCVQRSVSCLCGVVVVCVVGVCVVVVCVVVGCVVVGCVLVGCVVVVCVVLIFVL